MTRFDFLAPAWHRPLHSLLPRLRLTRLSIAMLAVAVACVAAMTGVQALRLHAVDERYRIDRERLSASEPALLAVRRLAADVADRQALSDRVDAVLAIGVGAASDLAWIGNRLPRETWLESLHDDDGGYELAGGARRIAAVGSALAALAANPRLGAPRLLSIDQDVTKQTPQIRYALRIERSK